jgi:hypothetical protein
MNKKINLKKKVREIIKMRRKNTFLIRMSKIDNNLLLHLLVIISA